MSDDLIRQDAVTVVARLKSGEVRPHDLLDAVEARLVADEVVDRQRLCVHELDQIEVRFDFDGPRGKADARRDLCLARPVQPGQHQSTPALPGMVMSDLKRQSGLATVHRAPEKAQ